MNQLITPSEVAQLLGVTPKTLANWRYEGHGPAYVKLGHRTVRYRQSDVDAWISSKEVAQ